MSKSTVRTPTIEFARGPAPAGDGDVVRRKGVIFRAGSYPEKSYVMTPDELRALAADFTPVSIDLGHPSASSPLDHQLGQLESVELSDDATTLFGVVAFPRWLEEKLGDVKRNVSASFDRATKRLRSLSLVTHPRIDGAELQAAFACACGGDHAHANAKETPMESWKEKALADLEALPEDERSGVLAILGGAAPELDDDSESDEDGGVSGEDEGDEFVPGLDPQFSSLTARDADFAGEAAALRSEVEALKAERRRERATAFALEMKQQGRIAPFEEACAAAVMFSAMSDDNDLGDTVDFAVGPKPARGSREEMVRTSYGQRIPHAHAAPADFARGGPGHRALDNGGGGEETAEQRRARLDGWLAKTPLGESILARRGKG